MDAWKTTFLLGRPIFRCELLVSGCFREGTVNVMSYWNFGTETVIDPVCLKKNTNQVVFQKQDLFFLEKS